MAYLDIILFAAIAAFVLGRLWLVLGRRNEDDPQRPNPFATPAPQQQDEEGVTLHAAKARALPAPAEGLTPGGHAPASLAGALDQIRALDTTFDEKQFLQGAKTAFRMIVEDFAKGDLGHVAGFIAPAVLEPFQQSVAERRAKGHTLENRLDRITESEVSAARVEGSRALITVDFTSLQMNVTRDRHGAILDGSPDRVEEVHDRWVFARDTKSPDPNWQLVETLPR